MELVLGQAPQFLGDEAVGDLHGLVQGLAHGHLADDARDGDGRPAAEGLELDVRQAAVRDLDIKGHHVAADGIADLADAVGVLDDAHVAGVLEMVHDLIGIDHDVFSSRNFV